MISKQWRHRFEYWGLLFLAVPWYYLPRSVSLTLGRLMGWLIAHVIPIRRQVVKSNLERAFPEKSEKEINRIVVKTYQHFGTVFADFLRQNKYDKTYLNKIIRVENKNLLDEAVQHNSGVILLLGHFGNWEIFARWLSLQQYPVTAMERPQNNPFVSRFINRKRSGGTLKLISVFESTSVFLSVLHQGDILYLLADQDARKHGMFVNFFDIPSSTPRGAAVFAHKLNAPIILAFPVRKRDNTYHVVFEQLQHTATGTSQAIPQILQGYMHRLQFYVRKYPDQYFWFHRRWKTQPTKQDVAERISPRWAGAGAGATG